MEWKKILQVISVIVAALIAGLKAWEDEATAPDSRNDSI